MHRSDPWGWEDPLEASMRLTSCLDNSMDREAWWATFQSRKELDKTEGT